LSWAQDVKSRELFIEGLKQMRSGVLIIIVSSIIGLIAVGLMFFFLILWAIPTQWQIVSEVTSGREVHIEISDTVITVTPRPSTHRVEGVLRGAINKLLAEYPYILALGVITVVLLLVSVILSLISYWARIVPGARRLGRASGEFTTASTLIWIGYFWGYLVFLLVVLIGLGVLVYAILTQSIIGLVVTGMGAFIGLIIASILIIIGHIGLIVLVYKLYEFEKNTLYLVITILLIISLVSKFTLFIPYIGTFISLGTGLLGFISWILLYIALGESISRAESQRVPPTSHATSLIPPSL